LAAIFENKVWKVAEEVMVIGVLAFMVAVGAWENVIVETDSENVVLKVDFGGLGKGGGVRDAVINIKLISVNIYNFKTNASHLICNKKNEKMESCLIPLKT
jgi:hypothetical protein